MGKKASIVLIIILSAIAAALIAVMCLGIKGNLFDFFKKPIHIGTASSQQISEQTVETGDINSIKIDYGKAGFIYVNLKDAAVKQ